MPLLPGGDTDITLDGRSREIFRRLVEVYLDTGEPVGSRSLSRILPMSLSPASVRNVMSDLETLGLIYAPHTSAGRMPTDSGVRFFVDAMLEVGDLSKDERASIERQVHGAPPGQFSEKSVEALLTEASAMLSGLTRGAGVVLTHKQDVELKHIEFVRLEPTRALVVLVASDGSVENRVFSVDRGLPQSTLIEAANYLNTHLRGRTLSQAMQEIRGALATQQAELDDVTRRLIEQGFASWSSDADGSGDTLIVRGQSNLLEDVTLQDDLDRVRLLFDDLEAKKDLVELLGLAEQGEGVRIFIGSETKLFSLSGSSLIAAPYRNSDQQVVGVLGVIGPTRLNYAKIVPVVDYTASLVSRLIGR